MTVVHAVVPELHSIKRKSRYAFRTLIVQDTLHIHYVNTLARYPTRQCHGQGLGSGCVAEMRRFIIAYNIPSRSYVYQDDAGRVSSAQIYTHI